MKQLLRGALILCAAASTVYFLIGLVQTYWTIFSAYEIVASYLLYALIPTVLLATLSYFAYRKDIGWKKSLGLTGMVLSAFSPMVFVVVLVNALIRS
ncbi:hypothetical protein A1D31_39310 [Bradyrhizobium liaoningense]|nr:hypothetical protein A1D31_39310 [Bradyrhizobium liaoningense]